MEDERSLEEIIDTDPAELAGEIMALRGVIICCEHENKLLKTENEKLKKAGAHAVNGMLQILKALKMDGRFRKTVDAIEKHIKENEALKGGE